jgi:hypothetical protein
MGGKSSAPPPVDYTAAAKQQGASNKETALLEWQLNNANQITPDGTRRLEKTGPGEADYTLITELDPASKARRAQTDALQSGYLGMGEQSLDRVRQALGAGFDTSGLPALSGGPGAGPGMARANMAGIPGVSQGGAEMGPLTRSIIGADPNTRQRVEDSLYDRFSSRFEPSATAQQKALDAKIANMGGVSTSKGARAMTGALTTSLDDQRRQAINDAIQQGGAEETRMQQLAQTAGTFQNTAEGQRFQEQLANKQQANAGQGQSFDQMLAALGFNNQGAQQEYGNQLAGSQAQNAARAQGMQEQMNLRQMPINELMAMLSGTQVNSPQFQAMTPTQIQATPWMQAAQATGQQNQAAQAAKNAAQSSTMSGIGSIAGMAGMVAL